MNKPGISLIEELQLPVIYQGDEPTAVVLDIRLFQALIERLGELEDEELFSDPEVIEGLREGHADYLAGKVSSFEDVVRELGLE